MVFSPVHMFSWHFWSVQLTKVSSHILPAFLLCVYLHVKFQNISSHILQAKGFSPVCIFAWHFRSVWLKKVLLHIPHGNGFSLVHIFSWHFWSVQLTKISSHILQAFLLCVSSLITISEFLATHPAGKGLFSCVYLLLMFQNCSSHILQAKGFNPVCILAWHFWLFRLTKVLLHIPQAKGFSPVCIF